VSDTRNMVKDIASITMIRYENGAYEWRDLYGDDDEMTAQMFKRGVGLCALTMTGQGVIINLAVAESALEGLKFVRSLGNRQFGQAISHLANALRNAHDQGFRARGYYEDHAKYQRAAMEASMEPDVGEE
jgi:hypothetical protein